MVAAGSDAATLKDAGNTCFKEGQYLQAAAQYSKALKLEHDPQGQAVLFSNRSAALVKLNKMGKALEDAEHCLALSPEWEKAYFRKAAVFEAQGEHDKALEVLKQAAATCPSPSDELAAKVKSLSKYVATRNKVKASATPRITSQSKDAASAWEFAQRWLAYAAESVREQGTGFAPLVAFQPGPKCKLSEAELEEQAQVQGTHAFETPDTLTRFVLFCRQQGEGLAASAVVAIVPQPAVAFPQKWKDRHWPYQGEDGVYVQLQSSSIRKLFFIRLDGPKQPRDPTEIPSDYALLPLLLRDD